MEAFRTTFEHSVKTMNPYFMDKLYSGSDPVGQITELVRGVLNTAVHVYHVSPIFSVTEVECVKEFGKVFGYDPETVDGSLNPGGTMSNMMALLAARHKYFPHVRNEGWLPEDKPVAFTPQQCHYSITRGAMVAGMGLKNMKSVPCDRYNGVMDVEILDKMIIEEKEKGNKPFFINCMGGSTVLGTFDDFPAISEVAKKHNMWMHIDGCWGGFLAFSEKYRQTLFKGSELSDSVSINAHKGFGVPLQSALLLVNNHKGLLRQANTSGATYLFHDTEAARYDLGDKTLSCGRNGDGLKTWMVMKRYGLKGFADIADRAMEKAQYLEKRILEREDEFEMVNKP